MRSDPLYLLLLLPVAAFLACGLIRIRVQGRINSAERSLFLAFGRVGVELDLKQWRARVRLFGWRPLSVGLKKGPKGREKPAAKVGKTKKPGRHRPAVDILAAARGSSDGLLRLAGGFFRGTTVEALDARFEGDLEEPHLTGIAFGCYQAAIGLAPALDDRLSFIPDWTGRSVTADARVFLAIPVYDIGLLAVLVLVRLPWRLWIRVIRGKERHEHVRERG